MVKLRLAVAVVGERTWLVLLAVLAAEAARIAELVALVIKATTVGQQEPAQVSQAAVVVAVLCLSEKSAESVLPVQ